MKAVVAGEGVRIEAKATLGVVGVGSMGTARGGSGAIGVVEGQGFGEQAGGNAPPRIATRRCGRGQGIVGRMCQVTRP